MNTTSKAIVRARQAIADAITVVPAGPARDQLLTAKSQLADALAESDTVGENPGPTNAAGTRPDTTLPPVTEPVLETLETIPVKKVKKVKPAAVKTAAGPKGKRGKSGTPGASWAR